MPCTYTETAGEIREAAAKRKARRDREINRVTNLLCAVCKELESEEHETFEDVQAALADIRGLHAWYEQHKKRDAKKK